MSLPLIDNFNRADENPATGYTLFVSSSNFKIVSEQFASAANYPSSAFGTKQGVNLGNDHETYFTIAVVDTGSGQRSCGLFLRSPDSHNAYIVRLINDPPWTVTFQSWIDDTESSRLFNQQLNGLNDGDRFGAAVVGDTLRAYLNGIEVAAFKPESPNQILSGDKVGVLILGENFRIEDFSGGSIASPQPLMTTSKRLVSMVSVHV